MSEIDYNPRISVVMAIYKEPVEWMRQAIDSILNQTFNDFEFIIINDNPSRSENKDVLEEYSARDSRIIVIENEGNIGLTKSLNRGLSVAKCEFIARMDADDIASPDRFRLQYAFLEEHPEVHVCGCNIRPFGNVSIFTSKVKRFPEYHNDIVASMYFENPVAHPAVMIRRNINNWFFRYNEEVKKAQDYNLWCDLYLHKAKFYNIQLGLVSYRISSSQISSTCSSEQVTVADNIHKKLLVLVGITDNEEILIHNEICKLSKEKFSFEDKKKYLLKLYSTLSGINNSFSFNKVLTKYAILTCLVYKKPLALKFFNFVKITDICSIWFFRELLKSIVGKI